MKFLDHKEKDETTVCLFDKRGKYTGKAMRNPKDTPNRWIGYKIAEKRAWIDFFTKETYRKSIMLYAIKNLNNDIKHNCGFIDPKIQRRINLKIRDYNNDIKFNKAEIAKLEKGIKDETEVREKINKKVKKN